MIFDRALSRKAYLCTQPIEYVRPDRKRRALAKAAATCVRTHPEGCRCWAQKASRAV